MVCWAAKVTKAASGALGFAPCPPQRCHPRPGSREPVSVPPGSQETRTQSPPAAHLTGLSRSGALSPLKSALKLPEALSPSLPRRGWGRGNPCCRYPARLHSPLSDPASATPSALSQGARTDPTALPRLVVRSCRPTEQGLCWGREVPAGHQPRPLSQRETEPGLSPRGSLSPAAKKQQLPPMVL